jgi:transposase-like protein
LQTSWFARLNLFGSPDVRPSQRLHTVWQGPARTSPTHFGCFGLLVHHIQTCIVHLTRYSLSFASWQERKHLSGTLRSIPTGRPAPRVVSEAAEAELASFAEAPWGKKYPPIVSAWRRNWDQVIPFFAFAPEIRRICHFTVICWPGIWSMSDRITKETEVA